MIYAQTQAFLDELNSNLAKHKLDEYSSFDEGKDFTLSLVKKHLPSCDYYTVIKILEPRGTTSRHGMQAVLKAVFRLQNYYEACSVDLYRAIKKTGEN